LNPQGGKAIEALPVIHGGVKQFFFVSKEFKRERKKSKK